MEMQKRQGKTSWSCIMHYWRKAAVIMLVRMCSFKLDHSNSAQEINEMPFSAMLFW